MYTKKMIKQIVDFNRARRCLGNKHITKAAACLTALLLGASTASAGLVFELNPANYDTGTRQWTISAGTMATDYFQCAEWGAVSKTTKVYANDGKSYQAIDFTAAGTIMGGPLCPASLGGANPRTIEAWCFQPSNANGDAMTILCLSRQNCAADGNFAFVNSLYNRSVWSNPHVVGWDANNEARSGKWVHLVASYDGTTLRCYVNGVADKVDTYTYNTEAGGSMTIGMMRWSTSPVTTPHSVDNADGWNAYRGWLGSIRVYDSARTAEEVAADYALGVNYGEVGTSQPKIQASVSGSNGTISPSGTVYVVPGNNQTFTFTASLGYEVSDIVVDGDDTVPLATSYTFSNVTADHTIAVSFAELPKQWVSGKVTDGTSGILGAKVYFKTSPNASVTPTFTTNTVDAAGNYSMLLPPGDWYTTASELHYFTPADTSYTVASSPVTVPDIVLTANPNWAVLFSLNTDSFSGIADGARITSWTCSLPVGTSMPAFNTWNNGLPELGPIVETIGGVKWEQNTRAVYNESVSPIIHTRQDGFRLGDSYLDPILVNGASVVAVVRPVRKAISDAWTSVVDIFYQKLVLGVRNDDGRLIVWRNNSLFTGPVIPDGQKTVLSLVVQPTGEFKVYANAVEVMNETSTSDMSALVPGSANHMKVIRVGRGWDDWTVFNGNMGDVYVYKTALDDRTRQTLQANLAVKFGISGVPFPPPFGIVIRVY